MLSPAQASALAQPPETLAAQLQATLDWLGAAAEGSVRRVITLGDAAQAVHLSQNHFCTVFSQETGSTFIEYLTGLRLERARELLEGTQMRSSQIAQEIGYRDPHYFSYLFKKHTGLSPRDWRRERQTGES